MFYGHPETMSKWREGILRRCSEISNRSSSSDAVLSSGDIKQSADMEARHLDRGLGPNALLPWVHSSATSSSSKNDAQSVSLGEEISSLQKQGSDSHKSTESAPFVPASMAAVGEVSVETLSQVDSIVRCTHSEAVDGVVYPGEELLDDDDDMDYLAC